MCHVCNTLVSPIEACCARGHTEQDVVGILKVNYLLFEFCAMSIGIYCYTFQEFLRYEEEDNKSLNNKPLFPSLRCCSSPMTSRGVYVVSSDKELR